MRKVLLTAFLQVTIFCAVHSQCIENNIFTRPDSASNPQWFFMTNHFDWLKQKYKLNTATASPGNDSMWSPIYQPDNEIVDHIRLALDMKPQDGWELLRREMGYNQDGTPKNPKPENAYIVMYNKYTSLLRVFYARGSSAPFTAARVILEFSEGSPAQSSLLDLSQGMIPLDVLFTRNKLFQSPTKFDNRLHQWFFADFLMQYDPCTCYYTSRLAINVELINQANIDISGSANGKLMAIANNQGQLNQQSKTFSFTDLQSGYNKTNKIFKSINDFKDDQFKAIDTLHKDNTALASDKKNKLTLLQAALKGSGFLKSGLKAAPYIGAAISLLDFFIGGGKKTEPAGPQEVNLTPTSIDMTIKLSGTITTNHFYGDILFWNPGSNIASQRNEDYPYYNEIMGIFNLTEKPKVNQRVSFQMAGGPAFDDLYEVMTYRYRIQNPIKYVVNPAARLALQDAQVALVVEGDSSGSFGPGGDYWELEGKDERSGLWQYRSNYFDVACLNKTGFNIVASTQPGTTNWQPRGTTYLKFLLNFKRLLDTAGAQNVLMVVKYPVTIQSSDIGTINETDPCTGGLFLHSTNTEINTFCNSITYKTNRVLWQHRPEVVVSEAKDEGLEKIVQRTMLAPNPTSSYSSLLLDVAKKVRLNIYVIDAMGRRIQTISNNKYYPEGLSNEKIDVQNLPGGIYNIVIENRNSRIVKKLMVQR